MVLFWMKGRWINSTFSSLRNGWVIQRLLASLAGQGVRDLAEVIHLRQIRSRRMGEDFLLEGYVERGKGACSQGSSKIKGK